MNDFDKNFTEALVLKLTERLGRNLTNEENEAFRRIRSGIAYEMIMDYISDDEKTKNEIEQYVLGVKLAV